MGTCAPNCAATAPTNVVVTPTSISSSNITWTPGSGGASQNIYVGTDKAKVELNCPGGVGTGSNCVLVATGLDPALDNYNTGAVLSPGTIYYYRVTTYSSGSCSSNSATVTALSSCQLSPSSLSLVQGNQAVVTATVNSSSDVTSVDFSSSTADISLDPASDAIYEYQTTATGVSPTNPSATITADVYVNGISGIACTSSIAAIVIPPYPWWQVKDGDVNSSGNLTSSVPTGSFFDLPGDGGFPGVPSYGGSTNLTGTNVSEVGWLASSPNLLSKIYDSQYFFNRAPEGTTFTNINPADAAGDLSSGGTADSDGFYWFMYSSTGTDLSIDSAVNLGSRKVILFVENADLHINAPINLTKGQGFFLVVAGKNTGGTKGNIYVDTAVGGSAYDLEGIYMADNSFFTGAGSSSLTVRGSVTAYGGILMERDLGASNANPSELYEYAPDQILLFPKSLSTRKINWKEVAP